MVRRHLRHKAAFSAIAGILLAALICIIALTFPACDSKATTSATQATTSATQTTTPTTQATTPATETAKTVEYPWKSLVARAGSLPSGIKTSGFYLEVYIDLGKKLTTPETNALVSKVTLTDKNGNTYKPVSSGSSEGASLASYDNQGKLLMEWSAEYAYSFGFVVNYKTMNYAFTWSGYEPLDIGNPYEIPFLFESE